MRCMACLSGVACLAAPEAAKAAAAKVFLGALWTAVEADAQRDGSDHQEGDQVA